MSQASTVTPEEAKIGRPTIPPALAGLPSDDRLFRELIARFTVLAETCARFSSEVYRSSGTRREANLEDTVRRSLKIARTVFGTWSIEILSVIHLNQSVAFAQIKKTLGRIKGSTLSAKLRQLEKAGLVQRDGMTRKAPQSRYSLTHKGLMIARLGEPVFLYLRVADGWRGPGATPAPDQDQETDLVANTADDV